MSAGEATANPDAVIIMLATCSDGHGGERYYRSIAEAESADAFYKQCMATAQEDTVADQWCSQIYCRIVHKHKLLFVAEPEQAQMITDMKAEYFPTLEAAYARARELKGADASLTCIPNGISVVVRD